MLIKDKKIFVMLGVQGSGKGTQAAILAKHFDIKSVSPGEMFRRAIAKKTVIGRLAALFINHGKLVPSAVTNRLVAQTLTRKAYRHGVILDGYPRNLRQAKFLARREPEARAFFLRLSDKEAYTRLRGRRTCPVDGSNYHIRFLPPKRRGLCDVCGVKLARRKDDASKAIRARIAIFHEETEPVIDFYREHNRLIEIDGSKSVKVVAKNIARALKV